MVGAVGCETCDCLWSIVVCCVAVIIIYPELFDAASREVFCKEVCMVGIHADVEYAGYDAFAGIGHFEAFAGVNLINACARFRTGFVEVAFNFRRK